MGINNLGMLNMPFQKGNQLAKGHNGGLRKDLTVELITQLNEVLKSRGGLGNLNRAISGVSA
jgi:hypothetical protein